jgi:ankyrin repeat protein
VSDVAEREQLDARLLAGAAGGDIEAVKAAIQAGASVAAQQTEGLTALHLAVAMNDLPLTKYLVEEAGAPFVPDGFGRLPTVVAAQCQASEELAEYIFEKEATALPTAK